MKQSELTDEIAALRKAVDALQRQSEKKQAPKKAEHKKAQQNTSTQSDASLEDEAKHLLSDLLAHAKKDYEHLSPITALLIFSLGVALGGSIARGLGGKS